MKRYEIQKDDLEIEPDSIIDTQTNVLYECNSGDMNELCKILNKQDNKWQKLKEWLKEIKTSSEKQMKEAKINTDYYTRASVQNSTVNKTIIKVAELEREDE